MIVDIEFIKVSGAGNDFVVIDNLAGSLSCGHSLLAKQICSRHFGVGADGLLILERSERAEFKMLYYNADGSHGGMCGNGGRCIARYAFLKGIAGKLMTFEALDFVYHAEVLGQNVRLTMKDPGVSKALDVTFDNIRYAGYSINTGSPHFILFVNDVENADVYRLGQGLRLEALFRPEGTNVDFVQVIGSRNILLRTYERGVEAETLACGTGAVASALVSSLHRGVEFPVRVHVRSGEELVVTATRDNGKLTAPTLEGSAYIMFNGSMLYDSSLNVILDFFEGGGSK
jgi:diaminopimelate epimerase